MKKSDDAKWFSALVRTPEFKKSAADFSIRMILGEKIYGRRHDLHLTQSQLAKRAHTTQRIISDLEYGTYVPENGMGLKLYDKLAIALEIDRDYLLSDKINRWTFEVYAFIGKKLNWKWDIMQFMKLPYFVDLAAMKNPGFKFTNFNYVRYEYGPFDKNVYAYRGLFENKQYDLEYSYIHDFTDMIDKTLDSLPIKNGEELKKLSYKTAPMKKLKATMKGRESWEKLLDLKADS